MKKFHLSKGIDLNELYWLLKDIEAGVAVSDDLKGFDWEIVWLDEKKVVDTDSWDDRKKVIAFMRELKRGSIFPPITINERYEILSGSHRIEAMRRMGWKKVPVCKPVYAKPATVGQPKIIKDEIYAPLIYGAKMLPKDKPNQFEEASMSHAPGLPNCLYCGDKMNYYTETQDPPPGRARGPYWYCEKCGIIYSHKTFLGHAVIVKNIPVSRKKP